jgi:hypothetical protein
MWQTSEAEIYVHRIKGRTRGNLHFFNPSDVVLIFVKSPVLNQLTERIVIIHRYFRQKVQQNNKQDIFKTEGGHTFFIPVDEGFKVLYNLNQ